MSDELDDLEESFPTTDITIAEVNPKRAYQIGAALTHAKARNKVDRSKPKPLAPTRPNR